MHNASEFGLGVALMASPGFDSPSKPLARTLQTPPGRPRTEDAERSPCGPLFLEAGGQLGGGSVGVWRVGVQARELRALDALFGVLTFCPSEQP